MVDYDVMLLLVLIFFFFQAEDGIRDLTVTGVQTCALPISSGVPLFLMPLDSTQLKLDEVKRAFLFSQGTPFTDVLTLLYHQWGQETPTLFDPMTIAFLVNPSLCPVQPMRIRVDEKGFTRPEPGPPNAPNIPNVPNPPSSPNAPNAQVWLDSNPDAFFRFLLPRLAAP